MGKIMCPRQFQTTIKLETTPPLGEKGSNPAIEMQIEMAMLYQLIRHEKEISVTNGEVELRPVAVGVEIRDDEILDF